LPKCLPALLSSCPIIQVCQVHSGRKNAGLSRPCFAASMGSYSSSSYCNHILIIIFPTGTAGPFHECCRPKNNLCSCVVLGSEASNLNCQYCQRCSAPSRRTDGDYCNRINCLKLLQRNQDDERRCLYIGVQILNRLPKKKNRSRNGPRTLGEYSFWSSIPPQDRPFIQPGRLSDHHSYGKAIFNSFRSLVVNFNESFRYPSQSLYQTARINGQL